MAADEKVEKQDIDEVGEVAAGEQSDVRERVDKTEEFKGVETNCDTRCLLSTLALSLHKPMLSEGIGDRET